MPKSRIVHIVDDDGSVRQALSSLLASGGFAYRAHASAAALLRDPGVASAGCIVTDVRMPEMDGLELQRRLREQGIDVPVIVMTGHADVALAVEALKAGAVDFIEKPIKPSRLLASITAALQLRHETASRAAEIEQVRKRFALLSAREREVLRGLVNGETNKAIANRLDVSPRTIEVHRATLMSKMLAQSLSELLRMASMIDFTA